MHTATKFAPTSEQARSLVRLGAVGLIILTLTAITPALFARLGDNFFIAQAILCGILAVWATRIAEGCPARQGLFLILGVALLLRLMLLPIPPLLSIDSLRYVWDGRIQASGFNPYRYVPAAPELSALRDGTIFPKVDRAAYAVTIYPPAAQMLFFLVTRVHESVVAMKIALVACEAITIVALVALLRKLDRPVTRVVAYAWHPLAVWEVANNGHIDAAMVAMMMLAVWLSATGRRLGAGVAAAIGALFKPFALLVLPAFWRPWDWKLPLVVLAVILAMYVPYLSAGTGVIGFLPTYLAEEDLDSGRAFWIVEALRRIVGQSPWVIYTYVAVAAGIMIALALRAGFRRERPLAITIADITALLLAFAFLLSPDYPWYFLMVVPFVALTNSLPGWVLTIGGFLLYDEHYWDFQVHFEIRDAVFNLAVLSAMIVAGWRAWFDRARHDAERFR
jgi:alpha-1,6-mannosyltransferase